MCVMNIYTIEQRTKKRENKQGSGKKGKKSERGKKRRKRRKRRNKQAFVGQRSSQNETLCPRNSTRMNMDDFFDVFVCFRSDTFRGSRTYFSEQT